MPRIRGAGKADGGSLSMGPRLAVASSFGAAATSAGVSVTVDGGGGAVAPAPGGAPSSADAEAAIRVDAAKSERAASREYLVMRAVREWVAEIALGNLEGIGKRHVAGMGGIGGESSVGGHRDGIRARLKRPLPARGVPIFQVGDPDRNGDLLGHPGVERDT